MKSTVLFVGDVNVDLNLSGLRQDPVPDREVMATGFETTIGSSAAIAAVAYAALGGKAAFFGVAGDDEYGRFMKTRMEAAGIDVSRIRLDSQLRTGVTVNLVKDSQRTQVTFPGAIPLLEVGPADLETVAGLAHVHFAGIYLQPLLLPRLGALIEALNARGVTVSVDPQWDESEQWLHSEWLGADLVLLNADEAKSLTGKASLGEAVEDLAGRGRRVVVKDGGRGAVAREGGTGWTVGGHSVAVVDTIGAGDNFAAAFLYSRLELGGSVSEALVYANAAAARSCCFPGGTGARSRHGDVTEFLRERT